MCEISFSVLAADLCDHDWPNEYGLDRDLSRIDRLERPLCKIDKLFRNAESILEIREGEA